MTAPARAQFVKFIRSLSVRQILDADSRRELLRRLPDLKDPLARGAAWVTLWEEMLDRRVGRIERLRLLPGAPAMRERQFPILRHEGVMADIARR